MAQLKDLIVNGATRLIGDAYANKIQITNLIAPTSAGGSTYGPGTEGQVLLSNNGSIYWGSAAPTVTESTVSGWGFTKNTGTITGATNNGGLKVTGTTLGHSNTAITAKTTAGVYPVKIDALGHITEAGTAIVSSTAASGGSTLSLVTTGEKYTWNNKSNLTIGTTATTAAAGNHTHTTSLATDNGTATITLAHNTTYKLTAGGTNVIFKTPTVPTAISSFTNDAGYITSADVPEGASAYTGTISAVGTTASTGTNNGFARGDHVHNITKATIDNRLGTGNGTTKYYREDGTWQVPPDTGDTHHTAYLRAGASGGTANAATTTGNTYLNLVENGANRSGVKLVPGSNMAITSDANGNVTFTATNTVTTVTTSGSGNAITAISATNGAITATKGTTFLTSHQDISGKADKSATVSTIAWDSTNKKITKTINGTTSDVVQFVANGGVTLTGETGKLTISSSESSTAFEIPVLFSSGWYIPSTIKGTDILNHIDNCYLMIDGYGRTEINNYLIDSASPPGPNIQLFAKAYDDVYYFGTEYKMFKVTAAGNSTNTPTVDAIDFTQTMDGDRRVYQSYSTANASYPLLLTETSGITNTSSRGAYGAILNNSIYANPSTGTVTATTFSGALSGNATTATKLSNTPNNTTTYLRGDNSWQTLISSGNSTLAWNSEITLATVGGTAIKAKLPTNPNTDTKVKQTAKSDNVNYKLLMGANSSPTSGTAYEAVYDTAITVNPSTDTITATNFAGNATTASGVKDYNNSTVTKFGYSTSGMTSASWLGSWDASTSGEYRLRAISPANAIKSGIGTTAIGSSTQPVYWTGAAFGAITSYEGNAATATTATKLGTANKGSSTQPIYLAAGVPTECTIPSNGAWWSAIPQILPDGVMEIGKYIDFHTASDGTTDYDVRITAETTGLTISGTTVGTFSGNLSGNATTATTATNLSAKPSLTASGNNITVTAGGKTSSAFTVPYATSAGVLNYGSSVTTDDAINNFLEASKFKVALWTSTSSPGQTNGVLISGGYSNANYGFQLAIDDDPTYYMALRQKGNTNGWSAWKRIPMGDGTGASGTWGISIRRNAISSSWLTGRANALAYLDTADGYSTLGSIKTTNGTWSIGHYTNWANSLLWVYVADGHESSNNYDTRVYLTSTGEYYANKVWGAVYNDYAEMRNVPEAQNEDNPLRPGTCVREVGDGTMIPTTERLQRGCKIISDTFGFNIGETDDCKTPIAVSGRALVYLDQDREIAKDYIGWPVCSGPNGTVSIMTEEEEEKYPSRIVGTISEIPDYEKWGSSNVEVNGRIWIYVK